MDGGHLRVSSERFVHNVTREYHRKVFGAWSGPNSLAGTAFDLVLLCLSVQTFVRFAVRVFLIKPTVLA